MIIFDLETDGLLNAVTKIHCIVCYNTDDDTTHIYNDEGDHEPIIRGITYLEDSDCVVGHNIIGYDIPVIRKLYPFFEAPKAVDTLILSRLYHPNMMEVDKKRNLPHMPLKLYGRHSLESYGYRLGEYKGSLVRLLTGRSGAKRCRITASKTLLLHANYAIISTVT